MIGRNSGKGGAGGGGAGGAGSSSSSSTVNPSAAGQIWFEHVKKEMKQYKPREVYTRNPRTVLVLPDKPNAIPYFGSVPVPPANENVLRHRLSHATDIDELFQPNADALKYAAARRKATEMAAEVAAASLRASRFFRDDEQSQSQSQQGEAEEEKTNSTTTITSSASADTLTKTATTTTTKTSKSKSTSTSKSNNTTLASAASVPALSHASPSRSATAPTTTSASATASTATASTAATTTTATTTTAPVIGGLSLDAQATELFSRDMREKINAQERTPRSKYPMPMTTNHEYGWDASLAKLIMGDTVFHPTARSDVTAFADIYQGNYGFSPFSTKQFKGSSGGKPKP